MAYNGIIILKFFEREMKILVALNICKVLIPCSNKCNVGYGFVNLTSPEAAVRLYKAFHKQPWEVFNSRKICQVTYARVQVLPLLLILLYIPQVAVLISSIIHTRVHAQGLDALKEHFKNSKFPCDSDEYLPVVFSPPRDGAADPFPAGLKRIGNRVPRWLCGNK